MVSIQVFKLFAMLFLKKLSFSYITIMCLFSLFSFNPSLPSSTGYAAYASHLSDICQTQRSRQWLTFGRVNLDIFICVPSTIESTLWILMQTLEKRKEPRNVWGWIFCLQTSKPGRMRAQSEIRSYKKIFNVTFLSRIYGVSFMLAPFFL